MNTITKELLEKIEDLFAEYSCENIQSGILLAEIEEMINNRS